MVLALVFAASWGAWRLSSCGRRQRDRFVLRWVAAVSALLAVATALFPDLLPVLHLWLVAVAAGALMLWVLGLGPVRLREPGSAARQRMLAESLAVLVVAWLLLFFL